jgi:hypothetical protein
MRRVHLARTTLAAALLTAVGLAAAPAAAGGPTSALLSIPGAGSTASLYYTDPEYDELAGLVGVNEPSGTFGGKESGGHESGPGVTVTWLVHDVEPWRVDRIYLGGKDGPWISTQVSDFSGGSIWESPVLWHRPADGARLTELLDGLGLSTAESRNTDFEGVAGASEQDTTTATPAAEPAAAATTEPGWLGSAGWALGGLVGGALLTLAWTRRRVAERSDETRSLDGSVEVLAR